ncbi:uncharacterized protein LOC131680635 [Topomyia yanbarensis]|uniref:uncharacterized protein LOC131680635 n=1 Tax=Topomyia yanbarensis TaxID=2498891 RepID=UPI00273BA1F3|nr:uncharacterized protein LOC131680635 [Topomyia yanbarensis]
MDHGQAAQHVLEAQTAPILQQQPTEQQQAGSRGGIHYARQQPMPNDSAYCPPPQQSTTFIPQPQFSWPTEGIISPQQLAARHVVCKELLKFSGDPLEWPMFISAFESTTVMCGIQPDENLARLQKSLVGSAREKVHSILTLPSAIPEILRTLRDECGRPEQLVHCLLSKIRNAPLPNVNKLKTLVTFGREVKNLVTYIEAANLHDHLSNPMLLTELVGKLPPSLRLDWGLYSQRIPEALLKVFSDYALSIKMAACQVSFPTDSSLPDYNIRRGSKNEKDGFLNAHAVTRERDPEPETENETISSNLIKNTKPCRVCQRNEHKIRNCDRFLKYTIPERLKFVEQNDLCKRCLTGHVLLHSNGKSVPTFAFFDDGSDLTLLDKELAEELGLNGVESPLCLQWTSNVTRKESCSKKVQLSISGINGKEEYALRDVRTIESLNLPRQSLDYQDLAKRFPYLQGLPVQSYTEAAPGILIGVDNSRLKLPLNKRDRRDNEPVAIKTRLGWTVFGGRRESAGTERVMVHACSCNGDRELSEMVKDFFMFENLGVQVRAPPESEDDLRARKILSETTRRTKSGRFETGLLWKSDKIEFPNSYPMAERRLQCLERRLEADPEFKKTVHEQIDEYQARGYAHKASVNELRDCDPRRVWYLPLGIVHNPRKPNKIRVVWDAAARSGGTSLNLNLLKGPDLVTPLLTVLCRFRQKQYAITGDIRQMFHQLLIREVSAIPVAY